MLELTIEDKGSLSRCSLFYGLDPLKTVEALGGQIHSCSAGSFLLHEGERMEQVFIVLTGKLHAAYFEQDGREFLYQQILPSYLAGGEIVCTPRKNSPYGIYAVEDSRLLGFRWALLEKESPLPLELRLSLTQNLLYFVANQNIRKYYKIDALSVKSARERIMKYLNAQAARSGSRSFTVPMNREAMANYLCLNRSVLSHELKRMEAEGILRFRKEHFTLL